MNTELLVTLAAILIGTRLPSFFRRQQLPKNERVALTIIVFVLLAFAVLASGGFTFLLSLFRMMS